MLCLWHRSDLTIVLDGTISLQNPNDNTDSITNHSRSMSIVTYLLKGASPKKNQQVSALTDVVKTFLDNQRIDGCKKIVKTFVKKNTIGLLTYYGNFTGWWDVKVLPNVQVISNDNSKFVIITYFTHVLANIYSCPITLVLCLNYKVQNGDLPKLPKDVIKLILNFL